jgi:hypothetical protein
MELCKSRLRLCPMLSLLPAGTPLQVSLCEVTRTYHHWLFLLTYRHTGSRLREGALLPVRESVSQGIGLDKEVTLRCATDRSSSTAEGRNEDGALRHQVSVDVPVLFATQRARDKLSDACDSA